jgi:hypothetical protein
MPIEIKELNIKATITEGSGSAQGSSTTAPDNSGVNDEIVNICVEKVLQILKDKLER